ncbi:MAG TPA: VCBS repeat-containing protein, partial [Pirellulaceae bacterium]|nr:VCBS repeat-containing protein [Pirellulaceae bacterium]
GEGPWLDPKTGLVSGALEGEAIKVLEKSGGNAAPQNMSGFKLGRWSGNAHLWWTGGKPNDKLVLAVPVKSAGKYELFVGLGKAIDYGSVRIAVDNATPSEPLDLFNDGVVNTPPLSLGVHELSAGEHRLTVMIVGANPKAIKNYMFGLDYVILVPQDTNPKR